VAARENRQKRPEGVIGSSCGRSKGQGAVFGPHIPFAPDRFDRFRRIKGEFADIAFGLEVTRDVRQLVDDFGRRTKCGAAGVTGRTVIPKSEETGLFRQFTPQLHPHEGFGAFEMGDDGAAYVRQGSLRVQTHAIAMCSDLLG
jgi:hypothetical protein